ncbi:MAG: tRNA uridine-5-carboxymethylaminomethyl(34) synthesis GTPase MnmE, partial [Bacteroidales bacterium]|nr:tRNA uridine-5-carboxymethylaminomethyl(34) synthesis GTPase MnmE [Bacteroidales bacterium]
MNAAADTICAVATAPGTAGIAVVRVSGPQAFTICDTLWRGKKLSDCQSHTAHLGTVRDTDATVLDQAVATVFRGPHSYTGEDVVELSVHGSPYVQHRLIELLCKAGARLAEPGEFTRRAFTAGNIDLSQAEAIADLIAARSRAAHHVAVNQLRGGITRRLLQLREQLVDLSALLELELDFSEEDVEFADRTRLIALAEEINREVTRLHGTYSRGQAIRDGIPVAIAGPTNAGKSSLLNALVGDDRAIVSDVHGTTRDTVEDTLTLGDHLVRIIDTAGLRATTDTVELIGQERTRAALTRAAL